MTDHTIIQIHPAAPEKPEYGAPCNGCGVCCLMAPCPVSALLLTHRENACPALVWQAETNQYRCGMLQAPSDYCRWLPRILDRLFVLLIRRQLALDIGCDAAIEIDRSIQ